MTEFWAALVGAVIGGGFSFVATWWASRRGADDALDHWQRDKKAEALERYFSAVARLVRTGRAPTGDEIDASGLSDLLLPIRIYAPSTFIWASQLNEYLGNWSDGDQSYRAASVMWLEQMETEIRRELRLPKFPLGMGDRKLIY